MVFNFYSKRCTDFPESELDVTSYSDGTSKSGNLQSGMRRALMSWYTVDPTFYRGNTTTPDHIQNDNAQLSNHLVREVQEKEVFRIKTLMWAHKFLTFLF